MKAARPRSSPAMKALRSASEPRAGLRVAAACVMVSMLTSTPEEPGGLLSLLIPVICRSRKARARLALRLELGLLEVLVLGGSHRLGRAVGAGHRAEWALWLGRGCGVGLWAGLARGGCAGPASCGAR
eukprot:scaffold3438_cov62-Phaeocystis_antarctica.AAC.2